MVNHLIQELRNQSGVSVIPFKVNQDKVARLNTVTPLIEGGRVFLPKDVPWLDEFMNEMQSFPNGAHDDQVDALSMGLDVCSRMSGATSDMFDRFDRYGFFAKQTIFTHVVW